LTANYSQRDQQLFLVVTSDGFAGVDTKRQPFPENAADQPIDFGTIKLPPGHQVRLRVVDPAGKPVLGAWVEPVGSYAARSQLTQTDAVGRCTLRNLAIGIQSVDVRFGDMHANAKVVVVPDDTAETVVRLRRLPQQTATAAEPHKPLASGDEVPEWRVNAWTDGVDRNLSDYRGKVVVIEVWGLWCSPCMNAVAALKELQARFRDRDVVFLGIHTAGTELDQVRKLMELKEWDWPTGLDVGEEIVSGTTVQRYRVRGYPTTIVVGRDGRVVFNTDAHTGDREAVLKEVEQIAGELDIAWPIPEDISEEDGISLMSRMLVHRLSKQIEAALQAE
jgi:thiol-disulfide isomerase/thioredoxin